MRVLFVIYIRSRPSGGYMHYINRVIVPLAIDLKAKIVIPNDLILHISEDYLIRYKIKNSGILKFNNFLKGLFKLEEPDLIYYPTAIYFYYKNAVSVVMPQNMEPMQHMFDLKNSLRKNIKNLFIFLITFYSVHRASKVIAISKHVQSYLENSFFINHDKVSQIYLGSIINPQNKYFCNSNFGEYLLTIGSISPARGLEDAVNALEQIRNYNPSVKLIHAGDATTENKNYFKKLKLKIEKAGLLKNVEFLGNLKHGQVMWLLENTKCFIMTSRAEACPITAIEALQLSECIVSTNISPMREFFGNNAIYYQGNDFNDLAKKIKSISDSNFPKTNFLKPKNIFSWEECYQKTSKFFVEIIKEKKKEKC